MAADGSRKKEKEIGSYQSYYGRWIRELTIDIQVQNPSCQ